MAAWHATGVLCERNAENCGNMKIYREGVRHQGTLRASARQGRVLLEYGRERHWRAASAPCEVKPAVAVLRATT